MEVSPGTVFTLNFGGTKIDVTSSVVTQWVVILVIMLIALAVTSKLKKIPDKKQSAVEILVETINGLVKSNMGDHYKNFVPFIGTIGVFLFFLNLTGLIGVDPATRDINVTLALALISFVVIQVNAIIKVGMGGYLKSYLKPFAPMLFMNVLEKLTLPISLALRLFINMLVGTLIMSLLYQGLGYLSKALQFIIPIPFHGFFDAFDGLIQMFVFMTLTMVYTKITAEH
ncbi:MAG: F0F1 ATP synthase subunit A [Bacillota bacterium]|nr:F0F1 ATP synthase subunit A [Bacillota bacterium]